MALEDFDLEAEAIHRLENWPDYIGRPPVYSGRIWKNWSTDTCEDDNWKDSREADLLFHRTLGHLPFKDVIADACLAFPWAAGLLQEWQDIWMRSFPGWETKAGQDDGSWEFVQKHNQRFRSEPPLNPRRRLEAAISKAENLKNDSLSGIVSQVLAVERAADNLTKADERYRLIADALSVLACREAVPGFAGLRFGKTQYILAAHDREGKPVFRIHADEDVPPKSLLSSSFKKLVHSSQFLGPDIVCARTETVTACVLADMASQGIPLAWIRFLGEHAGMLPMALSSTATIDYAARRLIALTPSLDHGYGGRRYSMLVSEPLSLQHAQHFYIVDGRIVHSTASLISDGELPKRRLDDHVFTIDAGAIVPDTFLERLPGRSVLDRARSAMFAKFARKVARTVEGDGCDICRITVVDTDRGMFLFDIVDVNIVDDLMFDPAWIARALKRRVKVAARELVLETRSRFKIKVPPRPVSQEADERLALLFLKRRPFGRSGPYREEKEGEKMKRFAEILQLRDLLSSRSRSSVDPASVNLHLGRFTRGFRDDADLTAVERDYIAPIIRTMLCEITFILPDEVGCYDLDGFTNYFMEHTVQCFSHFAYHRGNGFARWRKDMTEILRAALDYREVKYELYDRFAGEEIADTFRESEDSEKRKVGLRRNYLERMRRIAERTETVQDVAVATGDDFLVSLLDGDD